MSNKQLKSALNKIKVHKGEGVKLILIFLSLLVFIGCAEPDEYDTTSDEHKAMIEWLSKKETIRQKRLNDTQTEWTEYLMYGYEAHDVMGPATHIQTNIQIGLRSDGIVVYRRINKELK